MIQRNITVAKTARYFLLGETSRSNQTLLIVCHGYAQLADEFLKSFEGLHHDNLLIVAPEGLHRFYAKGSTEKVVASWMTKEDRENDIRDYVSFLDQLLEELNPENFKRIILLGFSQGAATASRWASLGKSRNKIHELILFCGFFPPDLPPSGIPETMQLNVVTASDDRFISPEQESKQLEEMRKLNPQLKHIRFEGKHEIDLETLKGIL